MKTFLIFVISCVFLSSAFAQVKDCGLYGVKGTVKLVGTEYVIKTQVGTLNEVTLSVTDSGEQIRLNAYADSSFEGEFLVKNRPGTPYQVKIEKVEKMKKRVANLINPKDTGVYLLRKEKCL